MQWPKFLRIKLPKFNFSPLPKFFQSHLSFYAAWKRFIRQIPAESRSIIKTYQHFIVMGQEKSGKSELIQGLIEQSQDLYPFETTFTEIPEMQFYLGPRHVIQEMSFSSLENRSIKIRKQVIRLWKKLFAKRDPVILIAYDCSKTQDLREINKLAQLIAGKITLLAEIGKKTIKTRVALTNLDKIPGYLEFSRFLKQQNINFSITLSSNFESDILIKRLKEFSEEHLSLILTTVSNEDYIKILLFFKEMPFLFPMVEEFLRALASRVSFKEAIEIDMVALTSNQESSTAFAVFQWSKLPSTTLFFRYPMLKHQMAAACIFVLSFSLVLNAYYNIRSELLLVQKGVDLLDLLQFSTFRDKVIPEFEKVSTKHSNPFFSRLNSNFFEEKLKSEKNRLAERIRRHLIEPEYRKTILENKGELKYLYFIGLMRASNDNLMGKFILKHSNEWADALNLKENLLKIYISYCNEPVPISQLNESKASPYLPLTSLKPWLTFLKRYQEVNKQPVFIEQTYEEIIRETEKLLTAVGRLRNDSLVFGMATLLDEEGFVDNENIKTVHWIGQNVDALENFLVFLKQSYVSPSNTQGMNPSQFFVLIKDFASMAEAENELYNFGLMNEVFSFDSNKWTHQVVAHNIEKALQDYIAFNADTDGSIFFNNIPESPTPTLAHYQGVVTLFKTTVDIPGRYSRIDYERKVRSTVEKLSFYIESLNINPEEKKRFINFLIKESISYIKNYQEKYANFYDSYTVEANSISELKKMLIELTKTSSPFYEFLETIQHQTSSFSEPFMSLKHIEDLNQFAFLNKVLTKTDGKAPIDEYQLLMSQLLVELDHPAASSESNYFSLQLTPLEKLAVNIFQQNPHSYLRKVQECVTQMGVPDRFAHLFSKPILFLYEFGQKELKSSVEKYWNTHVYPQIGAVFAKFPFDLKATEFASFDEVNALLNPSSKFYTDLEKMMSIFCYQKDGRLLPIDSKAVGLDQTVYEQLDRVSKIAHILWDSEGKPKPLIIKAKPVPFIDHELNTSLPVKSCIVTGTQSIHNINQEPTWQSLSIDWWKTDQSLIGLTLVNKNASSKSYRSIQPSPSLWSFFALLKEGKLKDENIWSWNLASREGHDAQPVSFVFETDPSSLLTNQETR